MKKETHQVSRDLSAERLAHLKAFSEKIDVQFSNYNLLDRALTHRSFINESDNDAERHNERLEFLGDAVLELIVSEHLFETYTARPEGELTSFRAAIVCTDSLAETSRKYDVGEYLNMSSGERATGGADKDYLLANAYEAILGAIYEDSGYEACLEFVNRTLLPKLKKIIKYRLDIDSKTKFQEIAQSLFKVTPHYELIDASGPDHEKIFTMAVYVDDKEYGKGEGNSKQKAEEQAAKEGLKNLKKIDKANTLA